MALSLFDEEVKNGDIDKYQHIIGDARNTAKKGLITETTVNTVMVVIAAVVAIKSAVSGGASALELIALTLVIACLAVSTGVDGHSYNSSNKELNLFNSSKDLIKNAIDQIKTHSNVDDLKNISDRYANVFDDEKISPVYKINQATSLINELSDDFYADVLKLMQSLIDLMFEHGSDIDNFFKTLKSDFMHNINCDTSKA
jgi:hypothetical protein